MKKIFVLGVSLMLLGSCNKTADKASPITETEVEAENHDQQLQDDHSDEREFHENERQFTEDELHLDEGEKWIVNEEMKPFVLKGEELVSDYLLNNLTDHKALAIQLKEQNNQLIVNCKMIGDSHDELHKWLYPHLELVKALESETDERKANETVLKLQQSYREYHLYFH